MATETPFLNVESEIGALRAVMLHRPGKELEKLTPKYLEEMLFDDIPWLSKIQEEHNKFAHALEEQNCRVYYYADLLADVVKDLEVRKDLVRKVIALSRINSEALREDLLAMFMKLTPQETADSIISGVTKAEVPHTDEEKRLPYYIREDYPFYINPLPNLYFTRDPGTVIGKGIAVNSMKTPARQREALLLQTIRQHHPDFNQGSYPDWYTYDDVDSIEGGDILVLAPHVIAVGCSDRTSPEAIETLAERLFQKSEHVREVLAIQIPFTRAYMHLDTVFTMVDHDAFTIFPDIENRLRVFSLTPSKTNGPVIRSEESLTEALKRALKLPAVKLIRTGGGDHITAAREQWNDSTNTLAIAPGKVVTYNRNVASNEALRNEGIEVIEIDGSELVRGRGGPRCMSMPLFRENPV